MKELKKYLITLVIGLLIALLVTVWAVPFTLTDVITFTSAPEAIPANLFLSAVV